MAGSIALVGALLSACGLSLLVLDAQSGIGGWDNVFWQVAGVVAGVWCFVTIMRRAWLSDCPLVRARVFFLLPATVVVRPGDAPSFGLDRPLFVEVVRFAVVIVVGTLVLWRAYRRDRHQVPTLLDLWVVLLPVFALTYCALYSGGLFVALAIVIVTSIMLRISGHSRWDAIQPMWITAGCLALLVLPYPHRRARIVYSFRHTIAMRLHTPERTLVGSFMRHRHLGTTHRHSPIHRNSPFDLPPRLARELAIASIVSVAGYPGALAVAALFSVVGWQGFRSARAATTLKVRVMVAGMTATVFVAATLHMAGCLVLLSPRAGPLPFVSYGPGELVLAWIAIGFVAEKSDSTQFLSR